ncbi:ABC transporter substrate-binding protein [Amycolatopsis saalfeldensis]|uniref:Peptide/nickel transport system substrate-binding protein n=1 Tax=Amycolatopsis saalfeldensis TaxID=394193 RepID=A0A1H8UHI6_9PSEU|nr:ABC transporter substrate-binding protein [Amycolatopsis saalfeldensis]SEP02655.1 peptide/nickel transport system substrate-binding protein [Amycolatopsis saalfeldensis]
MRITRAFVLPLVLLAGLATACSGSSGGSGGGTPTEGGTAVFAEAPGTQPNWIFPFVDSAHNSGYATGDLQQLMYRELYWFGDAKGSTGVNTTKSLADPPVFSDNNSKVVINVKPYKWSNGETVNAKDVVFWMNMMFAEKANWYGYVPGQFPDNVKSATATGPQQVTLQLTDSYSPTWFTGQELAQIAPLPMAWDKTSDSAAAGSGGCADDRAKCDAVYKYLFGKSKDLSTYATDPLWQVVDGPWHLTAFDAEGNISYDPNPKYSGPDKPHLAHYKMQPFTSTSAEFNALRSGKTVNVGSVQGADLPQKKASEKLPATNPLQANYDLVPAYGWGWSTTLLNMDNPTFGAAFKQLYLRQAMQQTLDQETDVNVAFRGYGAPTTGPVPVNPDNEYVTASERGAGPYPFDKTKAKGLLTGHGWTLQNGAMTCTSPGTAPNQCGAGVTAGTRLEFSLQYSTGNPAYGRIMQQWKSDAAEAGIVFDLKGQEFNALINDISSCHGSGPTCEWQMGFFGYQQYNAVPTGDQLLLPGSTGNIGNYDDPQLDKLIQATLHSDDKNAFAAYEDYAVKSLPGQINMPLRTYIEVVDKKLGGVAFPAVQTARSPEEWYFTK